MAEAFNAFELKAWRQGLKLRQEDVAKALGVHIQTYRLWERGVRLPEHPAMLALAMKAMADRANHV